VSLEELLDTLARTTGPHALWILFSASLMEYVFPPFPGDTVTLVGAYYSVVGVLPMPRVFLAVTAGSAVGSALDYWIGTRIRAWVHKGPPLPLPLRWISLDRIAAIEAKWRRRGDLLILFNRFIPGIRGLFFVAAGMGRIHFLRVMLLGIVSASLWNALLLTLGYVVGANLEELERIFATYSVLAWSVVALLLLALAGRALWRRWRARKEGEPGCPR